MDDDCTSLFLPFIVLLAIIIEFFKVAPFFAIMGLLAFVYIIINIRILKKKIKG